MKKENLAVGIEVGAISARSGVVSQRKVIDHAAPLDVPSFHEPDALIDGLVKGVKELLARHPGVKALGVGLPGLVDLETGWVHTLPHVPNWNAIPLARILEERVGIPTVVENRVKCMAIAEWKCGVARGLRDVVFVNMGSGVGGAVIVNNRMVRGSRHLAGEVGQSSIDWQGRPGEFGNPGAVEKYLGNAAVGADTREGYAAAGAAKPDKEWSIAELVDAGNRRDPVALNRWNAIAAMLATAVANCCWLLNPEAVVIAGSMVQAGDLLFEPLREKLFAQLSYPFKDHLALLPASFGSDAATIGAAALALESLSLKF